MVAFIFFSHRMRSGLWLNALQQQARAHLSIRGECSVMGFHAWVLLGNVGLVGPDWDHCLTLVPLPFLVNEPHIIFTGQISALIGLVQFPGPASVRCVAARESHEQDGSKR